MKIAEILKGLQSIRDFLPIHFCRGCDLCRRAAALDAATEVLNRLSQPSPWFREKGHASACDVHFKHGPELQVCTCAVGELARLRAET